MLKIRRSARRNKEKTIFVLFNSHRRRRLLLMNIGWLIEIKHVSPWERALDSNSHWIMVCQAYLSGAKKKSSAQKICCWQIVGDFLLFFLSLFFFPPSQLANPIQTISGSRLKQTDQLSYCPDWVFWSIQLSIFKEKQDSKDRLIMRFSKNLAINCKWITRWAKPARNGLASLGLARTNSIFRFPRREHQISRLSNGGASIFSEKENEGPIASGQFDTTKRVSEKTAHLI